MSQQREVNRGAEFMLDYVCQIADGKDDDEIVFPQPIMEALAEACGTSLDEDIEPVTAGELRARTRRAKEALAHGTDLP